MTHMGKHGDNGDPAPPQLAQLPLLDIPEVALLVFAWPHLSADVRNCDSPFDLSSAWAVRANVTIDDAMNWGPVLLSNGIVARDGTVHHEVTELLNRRANSKLAGLAGFDKEKTVVQFLAGMGLGARMAWLEAQGLLDE